MANELNRRRELNALSADPAKLETRDSADTVMVVGEELREELNAATQAALLQQGRVCLEQLQVALEARSREVGHPDTLRALGALSVALRALEEVG